MFAIIEVDQCYEEINSLECIKTFSTEPEANDFVKQMCDDRNAAWKKRMDYIEEFVDAIDLPDADDVDYEGWKEYLKQYSPFGERYVFLKDFKKELKGYLRTHYNNTIEGYDPPPSVAWDRNLFVVEIGGES
jgi:hypothetical protein